MSGFRPKKTQEQFIEESKKIHGDKYDYSKVNYVNNREKVCIICKRHGEFWQEAGGHLKGYGCIKCYQEDRKKKRLVSGVGINDYNGSISVDGKELRSYQTWRNMIARCYCENTRNKYKTYENCEVCDEWKYFSNFKRWYDENCIVGYDLDKDLLIPDNKLYSPETCLFVPHRLNTLFRELGRKKECRMTGVSFSKKSKSKIYRASARVNEKFRTIGIYQTEQEAHEAFVKEKHKEVIRLANEYHKNKLINDKVYNAVVNYKII